MMEEVTMSVNESERRAIAMQAIRDLEDSCDSWERSGVSGVRLQFLLRLLFDCEVHYTFGVNCNDAAFL